MFPTFFRLGNRSFFPFLTVRKSGRRRERNPWQSWKRKILRVTCPKWSHFHLTLGIKQVIFSDDDRLGCPSSPPKCRHLGSIFNHSQFRVEPGSHGQIMATKTTGWDLPPNGGEESGLVPRFYGKSSSSGWFKSINLDSWKFPLESNLVMSVLGDETDCFCEMFVFTYNHPPMQGDRKYLIFPNLNLRNRFDSADYLAASPSKLVRR